MTNTAIEAVEKRKILIFEDEDSMQTILSAALMPEKFHLKFVSKRSIGDLNRFDPEIILLDHSSAPLFTEQNLCEKIKEFFPSVPLIVISAYPLNNFGSYNDYMDLFIAKPFDLNHFLSCISHFNKKIKPC